MPYLTLSLERHPKGNTASEFLVHAADMEGLCQGIDEELVESESTMVSALMCSEYCHKKNWANGSLFPLRMQEARKVRRCFSLTYICYS